MGVEKRRRGKWGATKRGGGRRENRRLGVRRKEYKQAEEEEKQTCSSPFCLCFNFIIPLGTARGAVKLNRKGSSKITTDIKASRGKILLRFPPASSFDLLHCCVCLHRLRLILQIVTGF